MGAVAIPLRDARPATMVFKRVVSAVILIPAAIWIVAIAPPWVFRATVIALSAVAAWELGRLFRQAGRLVWPWMGALCAAAVTASFATMDPTWAGELAVAVPGGAVLAALTMTTALILATSLWTARSPGSDTATIGLSGLCYVGVLMGHALLIQQLPDGRGLVLFLLGVTWAGETAAYAVGSLLGRQKLAPRISPGKTIEGAVAQVIGSALAAWILGGLTSGWSAIEALGAGVILGIVGQVGDLTESAIKRSVGAKDAGGAIPGHGGLLDRIDGLLFNIPALFYYAGVLGGRA